MQIKLMSSTPTARASSAAKAKASLVTAQHLLGRSTINMTTRYAHLFADDKMAAVKRLDFTGVR
jgi:hypothetical protein